MALAARLPRSPTPRSTGFTLVELLVVVAIIALLVSILIPGYGRVRSLSRSTACRSNLRQMWEAFHDTGGSLSFPRPSGWVQFVYGRNLDGLARCPEDEFDADSHAAADLGDLYLVQDPGGLTFYPVMDIIQNLGSAGSFFQLDVIVRGPSEYEFWLDNDGACSISIGKTIVVTPMDAPGAATCGSDHWVCYGPHIGTPNWNSDVVRRLTGMSYRQVDPPFEVQAVPCSYGMNINTATVDSRPDRILLLDYRKAIADPVADNVAGGMPQLDPERHLGKVNAVFVDGSVRGLWPDEVAPTARLWK